MIKWLYIAIAFLIDNIIMVIFPYDYGLINYNFTPACTTIVLLVLAKDFDLYEYLFIVLITSIFYSLLFYNDILIYAFVFMVVGFISKVWSFYITYSYLEYTLVGVAIITLKEFFLFFIFAMLKNRQIPFILWLFKDLFLTITINIFLIIIIIKIGKLIQDYYKLGSFKTNK